MTHKFSFKKAYLCFVAVLIVLIAICIIHVSSVLKEYEASQPEHHVNDKLTQIRTAAKNGSLSSEIKRDGLTPEEIALITKKLASDNLEAKLTGNNDGGEALVYTVFSDGDEVIQINLSGKPGKSALMLFNMTDWTVGDITPYRHEYNLTLPKALSVFVSGKPASGEEINGNIKYNISSISKTTVKIRDVLGNETEYDGKTKLSITEFVIEIPSNFIITSSSGSIVPVTLAETTEIEEYKYIAQYTSMPSTARYKLGLLTDNPDIIIKDNLGNNAEYKIEDHKIVITTQASSPDVALSTITKEDILEFARNWSHLMTDDLGGANRGYEKIKEYLLPDSYQLEKAYEWISHVDINFTTPHTLDNPPFRLEEVSNFIQYNSECFSVDVKLEKVMHLNSHEDRVEVLNERIYYVLTDAWYVAFMQPII